MAELHPPEPCPGKRILLLNSLLGVFVSIPLCSPSCSLGKARTRGAQEYGVRSCRRWSGCCWALCSCPLARVEILAKKPLVLDTKCTQEREAQEQWTLQIFTLTSVLAPNNPCAAFPAQLRAL